FGTTPRPVDTTDHPELQGVTQNDANRLRYATGATSPRDGPAPALLAITDPKSRAKLSTNLTGSVTVAHLLVGITGQDDLMPVYQDLGGGDLATLLQNLDLPVTPEDKITIVGSTDGITPDVVGVAQGNEGAQGSLSLTTLGVAADPRLMAPVTGNGAGFHFYQLTASGSVDLGTATIQATAVNHAPVLAPISSQAVTYGSTVTFTASAT